MIHFQYFMIGRQSATQENSRRNTSLFRIRSSHDRNRDLSWKPSFWGNHKIKKNKKIFVFFLAFLCVIFSKGIVIPKINTDPKKKIGNYFVRKIDEKNRKCSKEKSNIFGSTLDPTTMCVDLVPVSELDSQHHYAFPTRRRHDIVTNGKVTETSDSLN